MDFLVGVGLWPDVAGPFNAPFFAVDVRAGEFGRGSSIGASAL